ncbi:unnamed protein product, partial [Meganyctiphanes norvegica]
FHLVCLYLCAVSSFQIQGNHNRMSEQSSIGEVPVGEQREEPNPKSAKVVHSDQSVEQGLGSVVASHYNNLEEKGRKERKNSRIFFMRNFNNWIKSCFINIFLDKIRKQNVDNYPIRVLDLGCGKGGDLLKWQKGHIGHLIMADIAETSVSQAKDRYMTNKSRGRGRGPGFTAEFITADCTKSRLKDLVEQPDQQVDLVSCQFAFHYCFESLPQAETMLRNVSENLKTGGYFIATMPSAYEIMKRLKENGSTFRNEVFRIQFPEDRPEDPPLFGDKYNFYLEGVVDCPEFLVHPPTLDKLCERWGLKPMWRKPFATLFNEGQRDHEGRKLLGVMKALEMFPESEQASETAEEYLHAQEHMSKHSLKKVRTLTKSEWEAIGVYIACAYKKV